MTPGICILPHHRDPDRPRGTAEGLLVCKGHYDRVLEQLDDIQSLLFEVPDVFPVKGGSDGRSSKGAAPPVPVRLDVIALHDPRNGQATEPGDIPDVWGVLSAWAAQVIEERPARDVGPVGTLKANHDWVCAQDWVGDYTAELRLVENALRSVTGLQRPKPVGRCPRFIGTGKDIRECGGGIWPILDGEGKPTDSVGCSACGEVRSGMERVRLRLMMEAG